MTLCEKCIHYDVCKDEYKDKLRCSDFKNKANFEWTSVKDKLPKENGDYLCCCEDKYICIYSFAKNLSKIDKYDFHGKRKSGWYDYDSDWGYYEISSVTHWMPLPELPKEVKQNDL